MAASRLKLAPGILILCIWTTFVQAKVQGVFSPDTIPLDRLTNDLGQKFISNWEHIGLSVGIIKNGKRYTYNFGTVKKNSNQATTPNTIYEIASITKSFTGILLAHAVLENKIKLNDDVSKYLPGGFGNLAYKGVSVKVIDLVSHTSGLPKFLPEFKQDKSPYQLTRIFDNLSEAKFLQSLLKVRIDTIPGTRFKYSNADAQLLGIILERIYHTGYGQLLDKYITSPQHMADTKLEVPFSDHARFVTGYDIKGEKMPRLTWWRNLPAAGYIKSTVNDMLQYMAMNIDETDPAVALAHKSTFRISDEGGDHIALFWFIKHSENGDREIYHAGGGFGSTSYCEICPDRGTGVVLLANDASADTELALKALAAKLMTAIR